MIQCNHKHGNMDIESDEKVLLLGAGFSKNFGAPLASEMWYLIFNHKKVQAHSRIRKLMLKYFNYEFVFNSVLEGFEDKEKLFSEECSFIEFSDNEKDAIREATYFAYEHVNKVFTQFMEYLENPKKENTRQKEILTGVSQFISLFHQVYYLVTGDGIPFCTADGVLFGFCKRSFIFTLNQDSFFENCYNKSCTEMSSPEVYIPGIKGEQDEFKLVKLPTESELYGKNILSDKKFLLLKLHGSYNWVCHNNNNNNNNRAMVIGRGKKEQIQKEPLLKRYFEIFKEVLSQKERRLLIIGYSFSDDHINSVISEALKNNGLKIYILSPESIEKLRERLFNNDESQNDKSQTTPKERENLSTIYYGISGYFPYTEILTGDSVLDKPIIDNFKDTFLNEK